MKAERRHELQTNELVQVSTKLVENYKDILPRIGVGLVIILAAIAGWTMWSKASEGKKASAWAALADARNAPSAEARIRRLKDVMSKNPGTELSLWAQLDLADLYMNDARVKLNTEPSVARKLMSDAQELYKNVFEETGATQEMRILAALASGACLEMIGERAMAVDQYRAVAENAPNDSIKAEAEKRASTLERESAVEFYKWYANYTPPAPGSGDLPMTPPSFLNPDLNLDEEPKGEIPEVPAAQTPELNLPGESTKGAEEAQESKPAPGSDGEPKTPETSPKQDESPAAGESPKQDESPANDGSSKQDESPKQEPPQ